MGDDDDVNPFRLPTDDQWFFFQEQEVLKKEADAEKTKGQKAHEKTTCSSRISANRRIEEILPFKSSPSEASLPSSAPCGSGLAALPPVLPASADGSRSGRRSRAASVGSRGSGVSSDAAWRERDSKHEYIAKKHQEFLSQMNLNNKQAEIDRLEEKASMREEALQTSQRQLDEDIKRFEEFLQRNDQKAHESMKSAEEMTKRKVDKLAKIRSLKVALGSLQSEIAKLREHKEECMKLKEFLEGITPPEWTEAKMEEKHTRKLSRKGTWVDRQFQTSDRSMRAEIASEEQASEDRAAGDSRGRRRAKRETEEEMREREKELESRRRKIRKKYPTREVLEAKYTEEFGGDSSGEDLPLYFKEPDQLLDIFTAMEEANLFLIQNSQDIEQTIEELQQKNAEARRTAAASREKMHTQLELLERQIEEEKQKSADFKKRIEAQDTASDQESLEQYLCEKAIEVYAACGHEAERDPDTLKMLAATEARVEEFLTLFEEAEASGFQNVVEQLEREKEHARRQMVKLLRKEAQDRKTKDRTKAALLRSQAPIHKKTGKQIMYRSPPGYTMQRVVEEDDGYDEAVRDHAVFGIWTGKDGAPNAEAPTRPA